MNMIERVARAIMLDDFEGDDMWGRQPECVRDSYLKNARAAIEAMREPTVGMHDAVEDMLEREDMHMDCAINNVYRIMIDAALAEEAQ